MYPEGQISEDTKVNATFEDRRTVKKQMMYDP